MPAFTVSAKTRIDRPIEQVRKTIGDFDTWPHWSPWLCIEPGTPVTSHGEPSTPGHGYEWEGEKVGSGKMVWTSLEPTQLTAELNFIKPFKSTADVGFTLTDNQDSTDVEWTMNSSLPFYLFFMVKMMKGMITMDYSRGLAQLKDYIEMGGVPFTMEAKGVVDTPAVHYLGVSKKSAISDLSASMGSTFGELHQSVQNTNLTITGEALSVYDKMNMGSGQCHYTAAIPVSEKDAVSQEGLKAGNVLASSAYKVIHTGPYRHLGNAWALAMSDVRHLKHKTSKQQKPYERYLNDPTTTPENELITEIYIPLR